MTKSVKWTAVLPVLAAVAGCGPVLVVPQPVLPEPLVERQPVTIAVHYPAEFRDYVHKETRYSTEYEINLGPGHVVEFTRLFAALFEKVVEVDDPAQVPALQPPVRMVLEPRFEDYAFLTPRDLAGENFIVTIRYRLNVYGPGGERVDGYVFTGYGRDQSGSLTGSSALLAATQKAMREAGAKLAVELPEEETVRTLLAGLPVAPPPEATPSLREALGPFVEPPAAQEPASAAEPPPPAASSQDSDAQQDPAPVETPLPPP